MAFVHGRNAAIWFNEVDMTGYLNAADLSVDVTTGDTTAFGSSWTTAISGLSSATQSFGGIYDPSQSEQWLSLAEDSGVLTYCPGGGAAIGDRARLLSVTETSYAESSPVADIVAFSWSVMSEANVAAGDVLHPLSADTDTTTGASKDETAATATGWTAHLHVTGVSAGSWVVTIEDSSTGSSGWATIATFTAATGATSERLKSAAATTSVKRYIRYVATRTGGSGTDTITFALAFARTA